jgi:hypothetical protein
MHVLAAARRSFGKFSCYVTASAAWRAGCPARCGYRTVSLCPALGAFRREGFSGSTPG